ncbi:PREDICTED: uncharacterized protein LOC108770325 isoform X2 [Trachymyrmex cornetzi]|uniref:uncharacterized protein LOC108770325 isoform X2 n=1 Tax=Trachymyrmex cornetzi TaxID=471704 RepID=UPI00084F6EB9|nr:PREDICTED: uncharacterized protein LOC108770325 isoform X2 [Trachymyrmex cornetzi]
MILMENKIFPVTLMIVNHYSAEVEFANGGDANQCLDKLSKETNKLIVTVDQRGIYSKGVISDWPSSIPDLWQAMVNKESVIKLKRMYRRKWDEKSKKSINVKTDNIVITMKARLILEGREDTGVDSGYDRYERPERWPSLPSRGVANEKAKRRNEREERYRRIFY